MTPSVPVVELRGVGLRVGTTTILRSVDLVVDPGQAVGLFGANGAGKTTLLRILGTLTRPSEGLARVLGVDLTTTDRYDLRPRIGLVGHTPALYPELTLRENLAFAAEVMGVERGRVDEVLSMVGLAGAAERSAGACSHGMQRRAEFARELMVERDLLLLDEPHSALDRDAVDLVEGLVARTLGRGGAAVLVSHDRDRVAKMADRCVELEAGVLR